jgi:hypothetical protein|tara:strand:- start:8888 stop:9232 length:345 start_codon:yes stop_codon:yes gene_type:complete
MINMGLFTKSTNTKSGIDYKYNEGELLKEFSSYVDSTYDQHYSLNKYQATEFIMDAGHGEGFCIGNILKYAQRYGKKGGKNRADLLKVIHYGFLALNNHDKLMLEEAGYKGDKK